MSGYDRARSQHTVRGATPQEYDRILAAAKAFQHATWFPDFSPAHAIEFVYLSGAHPSVLSQPGLYHLRTEDRDGYVHVLWGRPKKRGIAAEMDLPVVRDGTDQALWIPRFVRALHQRTYTTRHLNRLCVEIGKAAGIPFSFRTLRHTCGIRVARKTRDPALVQAWLGCSAEVALQYTRIASADDPRMLAVADA